MPHAPGCPTMVGHTPAMQRLRTLLRRYGPLDAPVLITGETGVGKELAARALHHHSTRRVRRFVAVNCAALTPQLAAAELFGSVAGAFTGARAREGLFHAADRGTLFLDEVGELDPVTQGALLRVLEAGRVRKVGDTHDRAVDVRVVSATHRPLAGQTQQGEFRADLYHRLAALLVPVPPLRDRLDDLRDLVDTLAPGLSPRLTPGAWQRLQAHAWPGNVRELRNVLVRLQAAAPSGALGPGALHFDPMGQPTGPAQSALGPLQARVAALVRAEFERQAGNVRRTARALAVSPTTVYRYLELSAR